MAGTTSAPGFKGVVGTLTCTWTQSGFIRALRFPLVSTTEPSTTDTSICKKKRKQSKNVLGDIKWELYHQICTEENKAEIDLKFENFHSKLELVYNDIKIENCFVLKRESNYSLL